MFATIAVDVLIERFTFLDRDGSASDIMAVTFANKSDEDIPLPNLAFSYREAATQLVAVRDHDGKQVPEHWACPTPDDDLCVGLVPDGPLRASSGRTIAVRVRRRALARTKEGWVLVDDPLYKWDLSPLAARVQYKATVVFPREPYRSSIDAERANQTTSRTASWDWGEAVGEDRNLSIRADQKRSILAAAPRALDNAIAEVIRLRACSALNEWPDTEELRSELVRVRSTGWNLPTEDELVSRPHFERDALWQGLLSTLLTERQRLMESALPFTESPTLLEHAEAVLRDIERELRSLGYSGTVSDEAGALLLSLIHYQANQRAKPTKWSEHLNEDEFQGRIEEFLNGSRSGLIGREVRLAGGRADFTDAGVTLELKVADLKGNSAKGIQPFVQQAAEYAASVGERIGFLLVLDEHDYASRKKHLPDIAGLIAIEQVKSLPTIENKEETQVVVAFIVPAFPPQPSEMKSATA